MEDLDAVIAAAGGSAFVFGMSSGGALALTAAAHGLPIRRLAVFEPPYGRDDDSARRQAREYAARLAGLLAADRRDDAVEPFLRTIGMPAEAVAGMRTAPMWPALAALAPSLRYDSAVMGDADGESVPTARLAAVTIPTLVLDGGSSPQWMRDTARRVADTVERGRRSSLDGQTHDVAPAALAPVLGDFFAAPE